NRGILNPNLEQTDEANFNSEAYLSGVMQDGAINRRKGMKDFRTGGERDVKFEDGVMLPEYRLPTEAEWEYAALGLQGNMASEQDERVTDRRIYPWDGNTTRYQKRNKYQGRMLANFKRGYGDYMGMAGNLNDNAAGTADVRSFLPNDFGLYHMAGNVNEWVADVYRPMTSTTLVDVENHDLNPYRGGRFQSRVLDEEGNPELDSLGRLKYRYIEDDEVAERENYKTGDVYDYMDGDERSSAFYDYGRHTLISNKARVYKGGSWADRPYWLSPGARRFKDEDRADKTIGFRCAMIRVGAPSGNDGESGNKFKVKSKKQNKRRF
ncbi:MAG: SUMF1/EgtB/PvdO family nonheme iron enzyme, partial [Bacteroidota bacterium]